MTQCINVIDPITLERFEEIPPQNVIRLTVGNRLRFYNVRALYEWTSHTPLDPETKIHFTKWQQKKIKKLYKTSVYQDLRERSKSFLRMNLTEKTKLGNNIEEYRQKSIEEYGEYVFKDNIKNMDMQYYLKNMDLNEIGPILENEFDISSDLSSNIQKTMLSILEQNPAFEKILKEQIINLL